MNTTEKLWMYLELINCNYDLYLWEFNKDLQFLHTNWSESVFSGNFLTYTELSPLVKEHLASGKRTPVILETASNLLWVGGFHFKSSHLNKCYFIGPIYSGRDSQMLLHKHLESYDLSVKLRSMMFKVFEKIPTVPTNIISQYAVMLHYCLNEEKITSTELVYQSTIPVTHKKTPRSLSSEHAGIWYSEQKLCKMLSEGDLRYKEALAKSFSLSAGMKVDSRDTLRNQKNNMLVLLTLCSRACIEGGLPPSISYDLNDYYAKRLEECASLTELQKLSEIMLADYVFRVRETKNNPHISSQIQNACAFIKANITEPLSIAELAEKSGYSEYYFSHKFKKEVGMSVNSFILNEKIEQAKLLLAGTNDSIQTISDYLLFSNRSYFYACFQKQTGLSPSEYRTQNKKV